MRDSGPFKTKTGFRHYRHHLYVLSSGILLTLIFPLPGIQSFSWIALVPLIIASVEAEKPSRSFFYGYSCGLLWSLGALHWTYIYHPLSIYPVVLITSIYPGLFALLINRITSRMGSFSLFFSVPVIWTSLEYLRSLGFLGFTWNSLGYAQFRNIPLIQLSAFTGVFGITFLICMVNGAVAAAIKNTWDAKKCLLTISTGLIIPAAVFLIGHACLRRCSPRDDEKIKVAGIQGSFNHDMLWSGFSHEIIRLLDNLTHEAGEQSPSLIVFPESTIGEDMHSIFEFNLWPKDIICQMARSTGSYLVIGAPYREGGKNYNSVYLVSPGCEIIGRYDKIKLVPGGEYFPRFGHKPFIRRLLAGAGGYTPGREMAVFEIPDARFSVLVCFEGIFGDLARRFVKKGESDIC